MPRLGYAVGPLIVDKKLSSNDTIGTVVASLLLASLFYLPLVPGEWPTNFPIDAILAVIALAVFCSAIAFVLLFALIAEVGPDRATIVAYINPAVAVVLGVTILGERLSTGIMVGLPLIALGTYLATRRTRGTPDTPLSDTLRAPS